MPLGPTRSAQNSILALIQGMTTTFTRPELTAVHRLAILVVSGLWGPHNDLISDLYLDLILSGV